jgi:hypothetical protein
MAWTEGIQTKKKNLLFGFKVSGIWPLNFTAMTARLKLFHDGVLNLTTVEAVS